MQDVDKGPRPYFADAMHPPVNDEGIRMEKPMGTGEPEVHDLEEDVPKEDEPKEEEPVEENKSARDGYANNG